MESLTGTVGGEYHALLARHDAMRLRNRLLSPRRSAEPDLSGPARYDGAADQRLITQYLDLVTPFGELIEHLYAEMFRRRPYLRSLFPASMDFQRAHLARTFRYLIENLHDPDEVAALFTRLGRDHRKLGVRPVHYRTFEAALRVALRRTMRRPVDRRRGSGLGADAAVRRRGHGRGRGGHSGRTPVLAGHGDHP